MVQAFHALSITDEGGRTTIIPAEPWQARYLARGHPQRDGWAGVGTAVMLGLLREKFRRYPLLADLLVRTGDARLVYQDQDRFWGERPEGGGQWTGRLLELVRAELVLARSGLALDAWGGG